MEPVSHNKPAGAQIEAEASQWVIRCDRGLTPEEQDRFLQWMTADPRHGHELARQRSNWTRLKVLADWRPQDGPHPNPDLLAPSLVAKKRAKWFNFSLFVPVAVVLAAAAALAVIFRSQPAAVPVATSPRSIAPIEQRILPDGTTIELNRGADVAVLYTPGERRVRLERGEAHFMVAKNPARPFIVSARGVDIRAVGTAFNVRLDHAAVDVLVTEGKVEVRHHPAEIRPRVESSDRSDRETIATLEKGQRTVLPTTHLAAPEVVTMAPGEVDALLAWHPRIVDFTDASLDSVVAEFNRRNAPVRIQIADATLARTEVSASLRSDNVEGFVHLLEVGFGVRAERSGDTVILHRAARR